MYWYCAAVGASHNGQMSTSVLIFIDETHEQAEHTAFQECLRVFPSNQGYTHQNVLCLVLVGDETAPKLIRSTQTGETYQLSLQRIETSSTIF